MAKTYLTDFTGAVIQPGATVVYASRRGNRVRMSEATVIETFSDHSAGRVTPKLRVKPTGRDTGFVRRQTGRTVIVGAEHVVVIG